MVGVGPSSPAMITAFYPIFRSGMWNFEKSLSLQVRCKHRPFLLVPHSVLLLENHLCSYTLQGSNLARDGSTHIACVATPNLSGGFCSAQLRQQRYDLHMCRLS